MPSHDTIDIFLTKSVFIILKRKTDRIMIGTLNRLVYSVFRYYFERPQNFQRGFT
jgi:hypothetical protein